MKLHERLLQMRSEIAGKLGEAEPISFGRLAEKADLSTAALTRIDRNSRVGKEGGEKALRKCAEAWGYSVDWLVTGRGEPRQKSLGALEQALMAEEWNPIAVAAVRLARDQGTGADWSSARWQTLLRETHELFSRAEKVHPSSMPPTANTRQIKRSQH